MFRNYINNIKVILQSYNNPLKRVEHIEEKDKLEREFYDISAQEYLQNFDEKLFLYDENEYLPLSHQYFYSRLENIKDMNILDCCCGPGVTAVSCAKRGALVTGIDISPGMIDLARKNTELNRVDDRVDLKVMSVQKMDFEDNSFDYVVGIGALHHLNLDLAGKEISRVLKPGGKVLFIEPRIPFKWLIVLRSLIPAKCHESPGGGQMTDRETEQFAGYFSSFTPAYFLFLKKFTRLPFLKRFDAQLDALDCFLVKKIPPIRLVYWAFVLEYTG
ncbi:class I SAM-dependent methyltransferase [candidate division KSB1 bacterium]